MDRFRRGSEYGHPGRGQRPSQPERRLASERHDDPGHRPGRLLRGDYFEHVLQGQRLEVEPVRGVVVGRDRLWVAVDHHGFEPSLGGGKARVHAGIVELDALADPVRPAAEDDDSRTAGGRDLVPLVVAGVQVRRGRSELGGAGVNHVVHRPDPDGVPPHAYLRLGQSGELADLRVGESCRLGRDQVSGLDRGPGPRNAF